MALRPDWPPHIREELSRIHAKYMGMLDKMEYERRRLYDLLQEDLDPEVRRYLEGLSRTVDKAFGAISQVQYDARSAFDIRYNNPEQPEPQPEPKADKKLKSRLLR